MGITTLVMFALFRNVLTTFLGQEWLFTLSDQRKCVSPDTDETPLNVAYCCPDYQRWEKRATLSEEKIETLNWKEVRARGAPDLIKSLMDYSSNASTCEYSDEEENYQLKKPIDGHAETESIADDIQVEEDIGEREMKLMKERARQIKRLGGKHKNKRGSRKPSSKSQSQVFSASPLGPLCLVNTTNALWNWSVQSGFDIDLYPPSNNVVMTPICIEKLENEALFDALIDQVLLA